VVSITSEGENIVIKILGWHQLWAFKKELSIKKANITAIYQNEEEIKWVRGLRIPGTHLPFVITAGTYYPFKGGTEFWDVCNKKNAIIITLENDKYTRIVVEVEDPQETMKMLRNS
jgi:hypothetical protein